MSLERHTRIAPRSAHMKRGRLKARRDSALRERLAEAKAQRPPTLWDLIEEAQSKTARVVKTY